IPPEYPASARSVRAAAGSYPYPRRVVSLPASPGGMAPCASTPRPPYTMARISDRFTAWLIARRTRASRSGPRRLFSATYTTRSAGFSISWPGRSARQRAVSPNGTSITLSRPASNSAARVSGSGMIRTVSVSPAAAPILSRRPTIGERREEAAICVELCEPIERERHHLTRRHVGREGGVERAWVVGFVIGEASTPGARALPPAGRGCGEADEGKTEECAHVVR